MSYSFSKCFQNGIEDLDNKEHNDVNDDTTAADDDDGDNTDDDGSTTVLALISGLAANQEPGKLCCACSCLVGVQTCSCENPFSPTLDLNCCRLLTWLWQYTLHWNKS